MRRSRRIEPLQGTRDWLIDNLKLADEPNERRLCSTATIHRLNKRTFIVSCVLALGILFFFTANLAAAPEQAEQSISLNLRHADLVDVLRMLAQIGGLNVIISSEVKGTITVQVDHVSAKDAFEILLDTAGLAKVQKGSVIGILPQGTLLRQQQQSDQARALTPSEFRTEVVKLEYAKAMELARTLASFLSPWGTIAADRRTNSLIIRDISESAIFSSFLDVK
jgi:type II secretory pathway component HofQ